MSKPRGLQLAIKRARCGRFHHQKDFGRLGMKIISKELLVMAVYQPSKVFSYDEMPESLRKRIDNHIIQLNISAQDHGARRGSND